MRVNISDHAYERWEEYCNNMKRTQLSALVERHLYVYLRQGASLEANAIHVRINWKVIAVVVPNKLGGWDVKTFYLTEEAKKQRRCQRMLSEINENLIDEILDYFGENKQILKAIEECNELSRALSRYMAGVADKDEVRSELADVYFTTNQMAKKFGAREIDQEVKRKINRTKQVMGAG